MAQFNIREVVAALNALDRGGKFADVDAIERRIAYIDNSDLQSRVWSDHESPQRQPQLKDGTATQGGKAETFPTHDEAMQFVDKARRDGMDAWNPNWTQPEDRIVIKHPNNGSFKVFRASQLDRALLDQLRQRGLVVYDGTDTNLQGLGGDTELQALPAH